jgi:hypothetical protein
MDQAKEQMKVDRAGVEPFPQVFEGLFALLKGCNRKFRVEVDDD